MRDDDAVELTIAQRAKVRHGRLAFLLRVHSAIEDESLTRSFEVITIRADLSAAREIDELHTREDGRGRLTRAIANFREAHAPRPLLRPENSSHSNCSKTRIQFRNRIFSICSSVNPRSISRRVRLRACE